jgi:hypothetical protein
MLNLNPGMQMKAPVFNGKPELAQKGPAFNGNPQLAQKAGPAFNGNPQVAQAPAMPQPSPADMAALQQILASGQPAPGQGQNLNVLA